MAKQINHYFSDCIGCGACVGIAPQIFRFNDDTYKAELISGQLCSADPNSAHPDKEFTSRTIDDEELAADTETLLTGSCCTNIIEVTPTKE